MDLDPETDYTTAELSPKNLCSWLGISGNRLGHYVSITIVVPAEPPSRRGQAGKYSIRDAVAISLGKHLLNMGITPGRIKECVKAMIAKWDDLYPRNLDLDGLAWGSKSNSDMFLVAVERSPRHFSAQIVPGYKLLEQLGALLIAGPPDPTFGHATTSVMPGSVDPFPRLVQCMSAFIPQEIIGLLRHIRAENTKRKA